jgi:thiol peroxidase
MASKGKKTAKPARKAPARKLVAKRAAAPEALPERVGVIELAGKPATVIGADVRAGQAAPRFTAQVGSWAGLNTWDEVDPLEATRGKVRILTALPSLGTSVCDKETRRFNEEAVSLGDDVRVIAISTDLPIAQKRWCGAAGVERVMMVSDHMAGEFGVKYGTLIKERRWFRRAVFVVGQDDVIYYAAYMPKLGDEPNYDEVLAAAKQRLAA